MLTNLHTPAKRRWNVSAALNGLPAPIRQNRAHSPAFLDLAPKNPGKKDSRLTEAGKSRPAPSAWRACGGRKTGPAEFRGPSRYAGPGRITWSTGRRARPAAAHPARPVTGPAGPGVPPDDHA